MVAASCATPVAEDRLAVGGSDSAVAPVVAMRVQLPDDLMQNLVVPHPAPAPSPPPPPPVAERPRAQRVSRTATRTRPASGDVFMALARCESGGNAGAHSSTGKYHGAFQFGLSTWRSVGYGGDPHEYPFEVQLEAARRLQARSGWGQWPRCARKLGLI